MFDFMLVCLFVFVSNNHITGPNFFWFLNPISAGVLENQDMLGGGSI